MVAVAKDGNCLFASIALQLHRAALSPPHTAKAVRRVAAEYIRGHPQGFLPFLTNGPSSVASARSPVEIEKSKGWGGEVELVALGMALERNIEVWRYHMPNLCIFPDPAARAPFSGPPIRLSFHMAGGGEQHYNSLVRNAEMDRSQRALRCADTLPLPLPRHLSNLARRRLGVGS